MENKSQVISLEELSKQFTHPVNVNAVHKKTLSFMDRLTLVITEKVGTMGFFFILFGSAILQGSRKRNRSNSFAFRKTAKND